MQIDIPFSNYISFVFRRSFDVQCKLAFALNALQSLSFYRYVCVMEFLLTHSLGAQHLADQLKWVHGPWVYALNGILPQFICSRHAAWNDSEWMCKIGFERVKLQNMFGAINRIEILLILSIVFYRIVPYIGNEFLVIYLLWTLYLNSMRNTIMCINYLNAINKRTRSNIMGICRQKVW